jgi:hypothetical protein
MALEFPQFADPYLVYVDVCAFIREADASGTIEEKIDKTAVYGGVESRRLIGGIATAWAGKTPDRHLHVHIRFASPKLFEGRDEPEVNATEQDVVSVFEGIAGRSAAVRWDSRFGIPLADIKPTALLHPILAINTTALNLGMRMTGGRFSIDTPPLERVSWFLQEDGDDTVAEKKIIIADVVGYASETLDDKLVDRAIRTITPAIDAFILGGERREIPARIAK